MHGPLFSVLYIKLALKPFWSTRIEFKISPTTSHTDSITRVEVDTIPPDPLNAGVLRLS